MSVSNYIYFNSFFNSLDQHQQQKIYQFKNNKNRNDDKYK